MLKLSLCELDRFFAAVAEKETLYLPVDKDAGQAQYKKWEAGVKLSDALNTTRSAKDFFFPQTENLADFRVSGKTVEIIDDRKECEDFVVFGVRACDARSFDVLDRVFLADPVDTYYKNRRDHGTVITLACDRPAETCFCRTFGIDAANPGGDVSAWKVEDGYCFEANTEKGKAFLAAYSSLMTETDGSEAEQTKAEIRAVLDKLPLKDVKTDAFGGGKTQKYFKSPKWQELSQACLGCGTCTFICPTCQCYDIRDFDTGHGVKRFRCWDSCMYSDFTKMSAGQPRLTQTERFRQRFMHKLVYFPENNDGMFSCVGCGRCLAKCPISMNIVKVMKALEEDEEK